jgi:hypothetical protein
MLVFISSPYTVGDVAMNVRAQIDAANELMDLGHTPFLPLLSHFQHLVHPRSYQDWIDNDLAWLRVCDCVLRLPGESAGADLEVKEARRICKPVYYLIEEIPC